MILQWSFVNHSLNTGLKRMYMYKIKVRTGQQCFLVFNFFLKTSLKFATTNKIDSVSKYWAKVEEKRVNRCVFHWTLKGSICDTFIFQSTGIPGITYHVCQCIDKRACVHDVEFVRLSIGIHDGLYVVFVLTVSAERGTTHQGLSRAGDGGLTLWVDPG